MRTPQKIEKYISEIRLGHNKKSFTELSLGKTNKRDKWNRQKLAYDYRMLVDSISADQRAHALYIYDRVYFIEFTDFDLDVLNHGGLTLHDIPSLEVKIKNSFLDLKKTFMSPIGLDDHGFGNYFIIVIHDSTSNPVGAMANYHQNLANKTVEDSKRDYRESMKKKYTMYRIIQFQYYSQFPKGISGLI